MAVDIKSFYYIGWLCLITVFALKNSQSKLPVPNIWLVREQWQL